MLERKRELPSSASCRGNQNYWEARRKTTRKGKHDQNLLGNKNDRMETHLLYFTIPNAKDSQAER